MVRERVRRDIGIEDSDEEDEGDADADVPAGWGRKKSAYYKEGDSEVMMWHSCLRDFMKYAQYCMSLLLNPLHDILVFVQRSVPVVVVAFGSSAPATFQKPSNSCQRSNKVSNVLSDSSWHDHDIGCYLGHSAARLLMPLHHWWPAMHCLWDVSEPCDMVWLSYMLNATAQVEANGCVTQLGEPLVQSRGASCF